jgi:hypothetical protein
MNTSQPRIHVKGLEHGPLPIPADARVRATS